MIDIFVDGIKKEFTAFDKALVRRVKNSKKKIWFDVSDPSEEEFEILSAVYDIHPVTVEDCLNKNTRIKVEEFPKYLFFASHSVNIKSARIASPEICIILGKNFIITSHHEEVASIEGFKQDVKRVKNIFSKGLDFLVHKIIDDELDHYFPILDKLDNRIDKLEDKIYANPTPDVLIQIKRLKQDLIHIKRIVMPTRDKVFVLIKGYDPYISDAVVPYFRDLYDNTLRIIDIIENQRDIIATILESYMSVVSNKLNEIMKVLTIIATIMMPLTLITGIYGMNFRYMPELYWKYGYFGTLAGMILLGVGMLYYFKRKDWL